MQLEQNGYITSEERQQITEWASGNVPKEDALHSFLHILSKSPLRSLKRALSQCPNSPGHIDLLKQIEAIGGFGRSMDEQGNTCDGKLTESQVRGKQCIFGFLEGLGGEGGGGRERVEVMNITVLDVWNHSKKVSIMRS